jgi:hypothetical protein
LKKFLIRSIFVSPFLVVLFFPKFWVSPVITS